MWREATEERNAMKVQILHLPSLGDPKFAVVFSEVSDPAVFDGARRAIAEDLGAESVLVFHDAIEVPDA